MTINNTQEFVEKYGECKVKFSSYYKYSFTFSGTDLEGNRIDCSVGGNHDDIYRLSVSVGEECYIRDLEPYYARVRNKDTEELIVDIYDY